jgi:hypothetical protein
MKNFLFKISIILGAILPFFAKAATTPYETLAPIPGLMDTAKSTTMATYLSNLPIFLIAVAASLSVIMITVGGILYVSSDAMFKKQEGKKMITNAVTGLILAIASYAILNTISPNLVGGLNLNLNITNPNLQNINYTEVNKKQAQIVETKIREVTGGAFCYIYETIPEDRPWLWGFGGLTKKVVLTRNPSGCSKTLEECQKKYTKNTTDNTSTKIVASCTYSVDYSYFEEYNKYE